jgi:hypothetical protein
MTRAVSIYEVLSQTIEGHGRSRVPAERPDLAFGKIGIAAVAAALSVRGLGENDRSLYASRLVPQTIDDPRRRR